MSKAHAAHVSEALRYCVLRAIPTMTPKRASEIWWDVFNDYGTVTERTVYRALSYFCETRSIRRVRPEESNSNEWGYLRRRR